MSLNVFFSLSKKIPKISEKLALCIQDWTNDKEFKSDPALRFAVNF